MKRKIQAVGFILAGGVSSRMGVDKGLLDFGGVPLILHTSRLLEPLVAEVTIVGPPSRYASLGVNAIPDDIEIRPGPVANASSRGPLAGIVTALSVTRSDWNLILACDLPYLSAEWISWLLLRTRSTDGKVLIPQTERGIEPLAALYHRDCRIPLAAALARGMQKVTEAISELQLDIVYSRDWHPIDPDGLVLKNMNTPDDYEIALKWRTANEAPNTQHVTKPRRVPRRKMQSAHRPRK
jgi:molybdopterin-guanine dinucleotide biosynthesis protein A